MRNNHVRQKTGKITDKDVRHLVAGSLLRVTHEYGLERVAAEAGGCDTKTISRARNEEHTLSPHCVWNLLDLDPTLLDPLAARKGFMILPLEVDFECDMELIAELSGLLNEWLQAMKDGNRNNSETKAIAARIRHLMPKLRGVVAQDDNLKLRAVA
jgi:hypothetical protein